MPKSKGKNTDEGEGNVAEGWVDLGIDNEKDKKKFLEIVNEEEKHVKEFIQRSNLEILESECDNLALVYSHSGDVFHEVEEKSAGCQPKTFKTFILMVKPLKPLFFSEKPLKTFIFLRKTFIFRKSCFFSIQGAKIL